MASNTQTAIIIGCGPFLSRSLALYMASKSYAIGLVTRSESTLSSLSAEIAKFHPGVQVFTQQADAGSPSDLVSALNTLKSKLSHVDVLVYNAARVQMTPVLSLDPATLVQDLHISAVGTLAAGQWFAREAPTSSSSSAKSKPLFLVTGGVLDREPNEHVASLTAAKAASQAISRMFATALADKGILVGMPLVVEAIMPKEGGGWQTKSVPETIVQKIFVPFLEGRHNAGEKWETERVF